MATTEELVGALITATNNVLAAVGTQQSGVNTSVAKIDATTTRVAAMDKVQNTPDLEKVVSTLTIAALALRQLVLKDTGTILNGKNFGKINGFSLLDGVDLVVQRSPTSLNRLTYDNRGLIRGLSATVDDSSLIEGLGLFQFNANTDEPDDDESCFTTTTGTKALDGVTPVVGQWLLQAMSFDLFYALLSAELQITEDWREDEPTRFAAYIATYFASK